MSTWFVAVFAAPVMAQDALEITATLGVLSDHLELAAEMESRPARLLASEAQPGAAPAAAQMESVEVLSRLHRRAGALLRVFAGEVALAAFATNVVAGTENRVQVKLSYPLSGGGSLRVEAPLLQELSWDGRYGLTLTVLDLVRKKVLGQSVLFQDSPPAVFAVVPGPGAGATAKSASLVLTNRIAALSQLPSASSPVPDVPAQRRSSSSSMIWWIATAALGAVAMVLLRRWKHIG